MNFIRESPRETPVSGVVDVAVCGGGIAGISAAISAAREGKSVLLVENQFLLGGLATAGLVTIFLPLCDGEGHQVSFGICEELIKLSVSHGSEVPIPNEWQSPHSVCDRAAAGRYECRYNPQIFAILCEQLLLDLGVKILYGTRVCAVAKDGNRITDIIVENKGGRRAYNVGAVVDATGDADICKLSSVKTVEFSQGNSLASWYYSVNKSGYNLNMLGFADVPDDNGKYNTSKEGSLSARRYFGLDGDDLSQMTFDAHASVLNHFLRSGKISADNTVATVATVPQIRMTRRIDGEFTLDTSHQRVRFKTSVGMVSDWRKKYDIYEIPFEILYNGAVENLFCAGRCVSVTDAMWDIVRVIPDCAVTGEAAGIAASQSIDTATTAESVIQVLKKRKIPLHTDEII